MSWNPFCECGNPKKLGRELCGACLKVDRAVRKGNVKRFSKLRKINPYIGQIIGGKIYRQIGDLLVQA